MRLSIVVGLASLVAAAGCDPSTTAIEVIFDPCQPVELVIGDASPAQRASVDDALAMWRARGTELLLASRRGVATTLTIEFAPAAEVFHGFYDPAGAAITINTRLDDPWQRAITIAHELGHAFGLGHVEVDQRASVMNRGNLDIAPTVGDHDEVELLWGGCGFDVATP